MSNGIYYYAYTLYYDGTIVPDAVTNLADMDVSLSVSSFAGWMPETIASQVVQFEPVSYRIVDGIPFTPANASSLVDFYGDVRGYSTSSGFSSAKTAIVGANYRWFPDEFTLSVWSPSSTAKLLMGEDEPVVTPMLNQVNTWSDTARLQTWSSARQNRTWGTLGSSAIDTTTAPVWSPYGSVPPSVMPSYQYWRAGAYATVSALKIAADAGMSMVWTPAQNVSRMTVIMVAVPHSPSGDSYTMLSANDYMHLVLNRNSTVSLKVVGSERSTIALSGRSRPNEPVIIGLSISLDSTRQVTMLTVDDQIRYATVTIENDLSSADVNWMINRNIDAEFDILEIDLYTGVSDAETLMRLAMTFNSIYGVTVP